MYINLEPCVHYGKTPPCAPKIIEVGIARVVIAAKDPNPLVSSHGITALRKAGIKVEVGCLEREAKALNEKFIKWIESGMPFVSLKIATSLDGKIATRTGDSKWITGESSREYVKRLRDEYDAILIGTGTVFADNPSLSGENPRTEKNNFGFSIENSVNRKNFPQFQCFHCDDCESLAIQNKRFNKRGIDFKIFKGEKIPLRPLLRYLGGKNISSVLVEGGSEIFGSFIDEKLVDKFYWFIASKIIGGRNAKPAVGGEGVLKMTQAMNLKNWEIKQLGKRYISLWVKAAY